MSGTYPIDPFGFTEYAVVLHADASLLSAVATFRRAIGLNRAMYHAHVTTKGTFIGVKDLQAVRDAVAATARQTSPFAVAFAAPPYSIVDTGILVPVPDSPSLLDLGCRLEQVLAPLSQDAYSQAGFHHHLTLCYGCTPEQMTKAQSLATAIHLGPGFTATSLDLMARTGDPLRGGYCTLIESFPLRGVTQGRQDELRTLYRSSAATLQAPPRLDY